MNYQINSFLNYSFLSSSDDLALNSITKTFRMQVCIIMG